MYLITCGSSWDNGDFSWVNSSSDIKSFSEANKIGPFLENDFNDNTSARILLRKKLKAKNYTNLSFGGSSNETQINLLIDLLSKTSYRSDHIILFGLKPLEYITQKDKILSINIKNMFIYNSTETQFIDNSLFNSIDLLSLMSKDYTIGVREGNELWARKVLKAEKRGLVSSITQHPTQEGCEYISNLIFNEIKLRFI